MIKQRGLRSSGWMKILSNISKGDYCQKTVVESGSTGLNKDEKLPKLPVPLLHQTLQKYENTMKPLLNKQQHIKLKELINIFKEDPNLGQRLQSYLLERHEKLDNWALDYWINDMYLGNRLPLPVHTNPGFTLRNMAHIEDLCRIGSRAVNTILSFNSSLKNNMFPIDPTMKKSSNTSVSFKQYFDAFGSCRIPAINKDLNYVSPNSGENHVIVIYKNEFYVVPIKTSESLDEDIIYAQLRYIIENNTNPQYAGVGLFTTMERNLWAETRERLIRIPSNRRNLELIEKSLFVICFDQPFQNYNHKCSNEDNRHTILVGHILHGGGSMHNSGNRWFDKPLQLILSKDVCGVCAEHTSIDGVVLTTLSQMLVEGAWKSSDKGSHINCQALQNALPEKLKWFLEKKDFECIDQAAENIDSLINDLDLKICTINRLGSDYIKSRNCSPDAFIQLAFQLAYYKINRKLCASYESCSLRRFRSGRAECIRPVRPEVLDWVTEMESSQEPTKEKKLKLWNDAMLAQVNESKSVSLGQGIDMHLLGLKEAAREMSPLRPLPELFTDDSHNIANRFLISSSQVHASTDVIWAFGPVASDGYGIHYNMDPNKIVFTISSFFSSNITSTHNYTNALKASLFDIKVLLDN